MPTPKVFSAFVLAFWLFPLGLGWAGVTREEIVSALQSGGHVTFYELGDSTSVGHLAAGGTATPAPWQTLEAELQRVYGREAVSVVNKSVIGAGVNYGLSLPEIVAPPSGRAVVIVSYMANNLTGIVPSENLSIEEYTAKLEALVTRLSAAGCWPVLETGPPVLENKPKGSPESKLRSAHFAEAMRAVAGKLQIPLVDTNRALWPCWIPEQIPPD